MDEAPTTPDTATAAPEPEWIGTAEAAAILRCTPRTATRVAAEGADEWERTGQRPDPSLRLVAKRVGLRGTFVIDKADAETFAASETWSARLRHRPGRYPRFGQREAEQPEAA